MPLFTPPPPSERPSSRPRLFEPVPRYAIASEPTGRQVTDSSVHETRKRSRFDPTSSFSTTSHTFGADPWADSLSYSRSSNVRSPPPLANDRYELAGGMEGSNRFARHNGDYDDYFGLEKQRGMWMPTSPPSGHPHQLNSDEIQASPHDTKPWVLGSIINIVGGVAGKLFQFCSVPFRGFHAGGGQAYTFEANGEIAAKLGLQDDPFYENSAGPIQQPLPGHFPEDNYGVLSIESLESERPKVSKRQRIGESWVVVGQDGEMESRPSTPRLSERRVPNHARSPSQIPRPVSRMDTSTPIPKRPSLIPVSRRTTIDRRSFHGASKATVASKSTPRTYSRQSYGSPVMFENKSSKSRSPLPPESQRLINRMRREELEDDARMRRMSSQMSDMLREAQAALGSKFEIEDQYMDDEAIDDDLHSTRMKLYPR